MKRIETRPLKEIRVNLFVRQELNEDHALYLASLLQNGVKLPPIQITPDGTIIDGRHRLEAHDCVKHTEIDCEIIEVENEVDLIKRAFRANADGPLPPTQQDIEHTVMLLLEHNESHKRIADILRLPPSLVRQYIKNVKSKMERAKIQRAVSAVSEGGLTVAKAAENCGVDPEKLKEVISGHRRKHKQGVNDLHRKITYLYKSKGSAIAGILRKLLDMFEDGDVSPKQVDAVFTHLEELNARPSRVIVEWKSRFGALKNPAK